MNTDKGTKERDYLFDNYKAFLITLVVIGHFIEPARFSNDFLLTLKWWIFSFHMPAFIFISGYFSKKKLPLSEIIRKLAVPYFVYEFVYYFFYIFVVHKETELDLLKPKFTLWYLMALFMWRALTPYIKRIPHYLPLSVVVGLLMGFWGFESDFLSLPRILFFYPFYLAGVNFDRTTLTRMRTKTNRIIASGIIIAVTLFIVFGPVIRIYSPSILYGRYNYKTFGQNAFEGIFFRLACYGIGLAMTFAFMILLSERKRFFSYIGTRTMAIYLFHGLTCTYLRDCTPLLQNVNTAPETIALLVFCILLVAIFSIPQFTTITNAVANIHLPRRF